MFFRRNFFPFFCTQFLGALNDNAIKNAMVTLIVYQISVRRGFDPAVAVTAAAGVFILPFFLFAGSAGKLCALYENAFLVRRIKLCEIVVALGTAVGFYLESLWILFGGLFLMGVQSTFFGPLKYSMLPELLPDSKNLLQGNAWFSFGTLLAILLGTLGGAGAMAMEGGVFWIMPAIVLMALAGWSASLKIPGLPFAESGKKAPISPFLFPDTWGIVAVLRREPLLMKLICANSWFWFIGATILSQLPTVFGSLLRVEESVFAFNLALFSVGVGAGSLLSFRFNRDRFRPSSGLTMLLLISAALFDFCYVFAGMETSTGSGSPWVSFGEFYAGFDAVRMSFDLLLLSFCGGFYFLPLITLLETRSEGSLRSMTIAGLNLYNALFMVVSALSILALQTSGGTILEIFFGLASLNLLVALVYRKSEIYSLKNLR